jgi:hypothetical protein
MKPAFPVPQRPISNPHGNCETLWPTSNNQVRALIAPTARHLSWGKRRTVAPSIPPNAPTITPDCRAKRVQVPAPSEEAPGWLSVEKTGERKTNCARLHRARRSSTRVCAELVTKRPLSRIGPGQWPARRCSPAPNAAASLTSPATTRINLRARQIRARSRPRSARLG